MKENAQQPSKFKDMKMDAEGNIYAIGRAGYGPSNIWLIKLSQNISGVADGNAGFDSGISVFPNPTSKFCRISFPATGAYEISVFNQFGKVVYTTTSSSSSNSLLLNSSQWINGIYLLQCFDKERNKIFTARIVKAD